MSIPIQWVLRFVGNDSAVNRASTLLMYAKHPDDLKIEINQIIMTRA